MQIPVTLQDGRKAHLTIDTHEDGHLRDEGGRIVARGADRDHAGKLSEYAASVGAGARSVLMDLGPTDVHIANTQGAYFLPPVDTVADRVLPLTMVQKVTGFWFKMPSADQTKIAVGYAVAPGAAPAEMNPGITQGPQWSVTHYALAAMVPTKILAGGADFDVEKACVRRITESLRLARSVRAATLLTTSGNWAAANRYTIAGAGKWNGVATPDPLIDMFNALALSQIPATSLVMAENVAAYFFTAGQRIRDYVQAGAPMPEVIVARAKKSLAGAPVYVWAPSIPSNAALIREPVSQDDLSTARTFRWVGDAPDGMASNGHLVRRFETPNGMETWFVVAHSDADQFIANDVGALLIGAMQ